MKTRDTRGETRDQRPETSDPAAVRAGSRRFGRWPLVSGPWSRAQRDRGFALLLVVTLLAFIVLLLLGLAVYTRIETGVAGNTQRQAQARENALLGLNVALAQLQRYAGPDERITATAESFPNKTGSGRWTGVWHGNSTNPSPLTWLVSGNELMVADATEGAAPGSLVSAPLAVTPDGTLPPTVDLVGRNSTGGATRTADYVSAPLMPITARGVPGAGSTADTTIGRYAWWVGDQGVKAPVAVPVNLPAIDYLPYVSTGGSDLRDRIRQQIGLSAGAATSAGAPAFEVRDSNNAPLVAGDKTMLVNQISFLRNGNAQVGLSTVRQNFHAWSPNNFAVIADTVRGGLRKDLSLRPDLVGSGVRDWMKYYGSSGYMEDPSLTLTSTPAEPPIESLSALRRRYRIVPPVTVDGVSFGVAPVLSLCLLNFDTRTVGGATGTANIEMRLRWIIGLWNPYSSALVPEDLRVEISGLPERLEFAAGATDPSQTHVHPARLFNDPLTNSFRAALPWDFTRPDVAGQPDVASWLPGRVYYWTSEANTAEPPDGNLGYFYSKSLIGRSTEVTRTAPETILGSTAGGWRVDSSVQLTVRLFRKGDTDPIATYHSPVFEPFFATDPVAAPDASSGGYEFSYFFRLDQNRATGSSWLTSDNRDPRENDGPDSMFVPGPNGPLANGYAGVPSITNDDLLLERTMGATGQSYNEDVPIFELPRAPILSLGMLQHVHLAQARPFSIGNSWGAGRTIGVDTPVLSLFDRYFFSGLSEEVTANLVGDLDAPFTRPLPNPLLKVIRRKPDGQVTALRDLIGIPIPPTPVEGEAAPATPPSDALSARFLLQGGAFNLNSTDERAWFAVLRSTRLAAAEIFSFLNSSVSTGSAGDAEIRILSTDTLGAIFSRFSQSAQETLQADGLGVMQIGGADVVSTYAASDTAPPNPPTVRSQANTHLYRQGTRILSIADAQRLANAIAQRVREKIASSGPFRSIEEFLSPNGGMALIDANGAVLMPRSLLEAAIADANINSVIPEFSSQWLTQGDVMTALAPILFPRSDTFVIRTYGEAVNPATSAVEGRAWAEAIVQRVPEYFDRKDNDSDLTGDYPETSPPNLSSDLNKIHGRRFKVVSFRWLTRSDI